MGSNQLGEMSPTKTQARETNNFEDVGSEDEDRDRIAMRLTNLKPRWHDSTCKSKFEPFAEEKELAVYELSNCPSLKESFTGHIMNRVITNNADCRIEYKR